MDKNPFTEEVARLAESRQKPYRITTGRGFYLQISPKGKKTWNWDFKGGSIKGRVRLGVYPEMSMDEAEERKKFFQAEFRKGFDPRIIKRLEDNAKGFFTTDVRKLEPLGRELFIMDEDGNIHLEIRDYIEDGENKIPLPNGDLIIGRFTELANDLNKHTGADIKKLRKIEQILKENGHM